MSLYSDWICVNVVATFKKEVAEVALVLIFSVMTVLIGDGRKTVLLKSSECSPEVLNFLANKACECYVALCDWESVQEWQASMMNLKKNSSSSSVNLKTDLNYIRCVAAELLTLTELILTVGMWGVHWNNCFNLSALQSSEQVWGGGFHRVPCPAGVAPWGGLWPSQLYN